MTSSTFGPWVRNIDPDERAKQFRSLSALAAVFLGSGHELVGELRAAETDPEAAARALQLLDHVPSLTRRRLLSTFGSVTWGPPKLRRRS